MVDSHAGIEYSLTVLEQIRTLTMEAYHAPAWGGVEAGGVLFGTEQDGVVRITDFLPAPCGHTKGPGFLLSAAEEDTFAAMMTAPPREGLRAVGWYHSRTRSSVLLSDADAALHRRHFSEAWQVAMVIRPERTSSARAHFFAPMREGGFASVADCSLAPLPPAETQAACSKETTLPAPLLRSNQRRHPKWGWAVVALGLVFAIAAAAGLARPEHAPEPAVVRTAGIALQAADTDGQLLVTWDSAAQSVRRSRKAVLEISDGGDTVNIDLDREGITKGSVTHARKSTRVDIKMTLFGTGGEVQESLCYIGDLARQ